MQHRRSHHPVVHLSALVIAPCAAFALALGSAGGAVAASGPGLVAASSGQAATSPDGGFAGQLEATAALSPTDAWSVGGTDQPGQSDGKTLIEQWNGHSWLRVKSPNSPGSEVSSLDSVSAVSADDVWASGTGALASGAVNALMEHWNGKKWSTVDAPNNPASTINYLQAVSADSNSDAWVAADYLNGDGVWIPYAEHWNGTKWSIVAMPTPSGSLQTFLTGVVALSPTDAWVVGQCINQAGAPVTVAEHWNGTKWSVVASPNVKGAESSGFSEISGSASGDVWAVGNSTAASGNTADLIEHWNGTKWALVSSPNPKGGTGGTLSAVTADSATDAWAVGEKSQKSGAEETLILHWNGTAWSIVPSPNGIGAQASALNGVSAVSSRFALASGSSYTASGAATALTLRWNGKAWKFAA